MKKMSFIIGVLLLISNTAIARSKKLTQALSATLLDVVGDVQLDGVAAKNGDALKIGSKLSTGEKGQVKALLGSGTVSMIGYNTTVVLEKNEIDSKKIETMLLALKKGSLRYLVSDKGNSKLAMVRSGDAIGSTRGGEALFSCDGDCSDYVPPAKTPAKKPMKKVN
jgi:hypothetical protein